MDVQALVTYPSENSIQFSGLLLQDGGGVGLLVVPQAQLSHSGTPSPPFPFSSPFPILGRRIALNASPPRRSDFPIIKTMLGTSEAPQIERRVHWKVARVPVKG